MTGADQDLLSRLESEATGFLLPLSQNEGFKDEAYERLCEVLRECAEAWAARDDIPKKAVLIFAEMNPWMVGCEDMYADPVKGKIVDAELALTELLLKCASSRK